MSYPAINASELGTFRLVFPPLPEQQAIAGFLDHQTAKLDALIAKKENLIALLKEKRQAMITQAVTKGLDPSAPMKDSGIDWLGEVPEEWELNRLKRACVLVRDGTHLPPPRVDDGIPLLSVRNIVSGQFQNRSDDSKISFADYLELNRSFEVRENDVLLAVVGATLGKVAIVPSLTPFHIQRSLAVFRPNKNKLSYKYLGYFFRSNAFQRCLWSQVGYSAQPGIYLDTLKNLHICCPDLTGQQRVVDYLDRETAKIDDLLTKLEEAIGKLKEYRTALITAAVTGKIDVRGEG